MDADASVITEAAIDMAKAFLKAQGYFVDILWHRNDIHTLCEQEGLPILSDKECNDVFARCADTFDGETGISWPLLMKTVKAYVEE